MKVNKRRRVKLSKRTSAIIALSIALVASILFCMLGAFGMNLDNRGLYRVSHWLPNANNWPSVIALGLDLQGGVYVEYESKLPSSMEDKGYNYDLLLENTSVQSVNR